MTRNIQGDVVAILNAAGEVVAEYVYDAWGNPLYVTDSHIAEINPIRYRGYYWDAELELYYLQSRYYCPALRRFISADVFMDTGVGILGTNMYVYCNNDPVNHWDPDGYFTRRLNSSMTDLNSISPTNWPTESARQHAAINKNISNILFDEYGSRARLMRFNIRNLTTDDDGITRGTVRYANARGQAREFDFIAGRAPEIQDYVNNRRASTQAISQPLIDHAGSSNSDFNNNMLFNQDVKGEGIENLFASAWGAIGLAIDNFSVSRWLERGLDSTGASQRNHFVLIPSTPSRRA